MCVSMNKMRDDQDFNIHFVKIIERERSLYDKSLPEYRSKEEHERIWQKISTEVNESGKCCVYLSNGFTLALINFCPKHPNVVSAL